MDWLQLKRLVKKVVLSAAHRLGYDIVYKQSAHQISSFPPDFNPEEMEIIRETKPFTLSSVERIYALIQAVRYVVKNEVPGDIVECGVWKGGSMMAIAKTLLSLGDTSRKLYLFDTFTGMPKPGEIDTSPVDGKASDLFAARQTSDNTSDWCYATLDEVQEVMNSTGYPASNLYFVKGLVEETIPAKAPNSISILRLDTDWYSSTHHELVNLFPRLSRGGVIVIDDYGHWVGAKKATDEYFSQNRTPILLHRIDATARVGVKS